jgi:CubicO group peptidase (beta-lactamase class C family)
MLSRRPVLAGAVAAAALLWRPAWAAEANVDFAGTWNGVLKAGINLRLKLVIEGGRATLYSLDQDGTPIPADEMRIEGARIQLMFKRVNGSYDGRMTDGRIVGEWRQGGVLPLTFERGEPKAAAPTPPLTQERLAQLRVGAAAPALAAAAANRNGRLLTLADGLRAIGRGERVTIHDKWHLGSITKSMTATLIARCVEAGAVKWDDTVGGVLGSAVPDMRAEYRDATFLHLASHRAGLQANVPIQSLLRFPRENPDARADRIAYAQLALRQEPSGRKGETFLYSNSGFVIAGAMLEAKLGAPWESLIRERVFAPLEMKGAGFGAPGTPGAYDQPVGHTAGLFGALGPYPPGSPVTDNPAVLGPAGRVHASFEDMLKYLAAHRDGAALLSKQSWRMLHTPPFGGNSALGWLVNKDGLWHNGSNTLWYAEVTFDPVRGVSAVAAANDGRLATATPAVHEALAGAVAAVT